MAKRMFFSYCARIVNIISCACGSKKTLRFSCSFQTPSHLSSLSCFLSGAWGQRVALLVGLLGCCFVFFYPSSWVQSCRLTSASAAIFKRKKYQLFFFWECVDVRRNGLAVFALRDRPRLPSTAALPNRCTESSQSDWRKSMFPRMARHSPSFHNFSLRFGLTHRNVNLPRQRPSGMHEIEWRAVVEWSMSECVKCHRVLKFLLFSIHKVNECSWN